MQLNTKLKPNTVKRFIVHQLVKKDIAVSGANCQESFAFSDTLFGKVTEYKWKKVSFLCLTIGEARYRMGMLEKSDKFVGTVNTYKIVCIFLCITKRF